jgi:hypothetical protein
VHIGALHDLLPFGVVREMEAFLLDAQTLLIDLLSVVEFLHGVVGLPEVGEDFQVLLQ